MLACGDTVDRCSAEHTPAQIWSNRSSLTVSAAGCCCAAALRKTGRGVKRLRKKADKKGPNKEKI